MSSQREQIISRQDRAQIENAERMEKQQELSEKLAERKLEERRQKQIQFNRVMRSKDGAEKVLELRRLAAKRVIELSRELVKTLQEGLIDSGQNVFEALENPDCLLSDSMLNPWRIWDWARREMHMAGFPEMYPILDGEIDVPDMEDEIEHMEGWIMRCLPPPPSKPKEEHKQMEMPIARQESPPPRTKKPAPGTKPVNEQLGDMING